MHWVARMGRNNSDPCSGYIGHAGDTRTGQTRKKPKDLSVLEREERGIPFGPEPHFSIFQKYIPSFSTG